MHGFCRPACLAVFAIVALAAPIVSSQQTPAQPARLLVGGQLVTPDGVMPHGWLELQNGKIIRIHAQRPNLPGIAALETNDFIFAGFVDLHNHPLYNIFPRWTPPEKYVNRYAWRDSDAYKQRIEQPAAAVIGDTGNFCDIDEYVEVKALIGGTTSLIGISAARPATATSPAAGTPDCVKGLARNLDSYTGFYGTETDHERVYNSIGILPRDMNAAIAANMAREIQSGGLDLLAIHIAEGLATDAETQSEVDLLDQRGLLTAHTVLVHAAGLSPTQFARVHQAGASIVWSPRSNFELYGATANVAAAFRSGVTIALAPDWSPSGSFNMLDEIGYASRVSQAQLGGLFSNRQLVEMATSIPARIARMDDKVGSIAAGQYADFFLLRGQGGDDANPYDLLAKSSVADIEMVFVQGAPVYGLAQDFKALGIAAESIDICGQSRALNSAQLAAGPFADVKRRLEAKLKAAGAELAPLAECR